MTSPAEFFSPDYFTARRRFVAACRRSGFALHSLPVEAPSPTGEPLAIDVALSGAEQATHAFVVSSGLHGVEGFFGSAVQLAFLEGVPVGWRLPEGMAVVLLHAINPFGFAWQRRFNEDNVDLNRNFLRADQPYTGAPPLCDIFRHVLRGAPWRFGFQNVKVAGLALRHGLRSFWETLPVGQYSHPDWLFFGGRSLSQSALLLEQLLPTLLGNCEEVLHLDYHTGLGRWADWELLLSEGDTKENVAWWQEKFGARKVKESAAAGRAYEIRGGFGAWIQARFPHCRYRFATAEFGTYSPMRVMRALTDELHWHGKLGHEQPNHKARRALTEAFVPRDVRWRTKALVAGLSLVEHAVKAMGDLSRSTHPHFISS